MVGVGREAHPRDGSVARPADGAWSMSRPNQALRVALTATSYPRHSGDWQSVFIERQLAALSRHRSLSFHFWGPDGPLPKGVDSAATVGDLALIRSITDAGGIAHLIRKQRIRGGFAGLRMTLRLNAALRRMDSQVDLFHLNWLQSALALPGTRRPALITVLGTDFRLLQQPLVPELLRHALRGRRVILAPNAGWMVSALQHLLGDRWVAVQEIPFGIDPQWYAIERQPPAAPRWITVLRLTRRKIGPYFDWTREAAERGHEFHLFGPMQEALTVPDWVRYHGAVDLDSLASCWYPQSTGMITLSQHDEGRPQVLLEAMASGLPIVASHIEAHRDLFEPFQSAQLVADRGAFVASLNELADRKAGDALGDRARRHARSVFGTWDDCATRYEQAYHRLVEA